MANGSKQADWPLQWQNRQNQIFYGVVSRIWPSFQLSSVSKNGLEQTIALKTDGLHPSSSCRILFSEKNCAFLQPPAMAQNRTHEHKCWFFLDWSTANQQLKAWMAFSYWSQQGASQLTIQVMLKIGERNSRCNSLCHLCIKKKCWKLFNKIWGFDALLRTVQDGAPENH